MATTWNYDGAGTLAVTFDSVAGVHYFASAFDSNSVPVNATASGATLTMTITGIGGDAAGYLFGVVVQKGDSMGVDTPDPWNCIAANVFAEGTASTTGAIGVVTWGYDGAEALSVTFTALASVTYRLDCQSNRSLAQQFVTGGPYTAGTSHTLSLTLNTPTRASFEAELFNSSTFDCYADTILTFGVTGSQPGNPASGPPPPPVAKGVRIAFPDTALSGSPAFTRIDDIKGINVSAIQVKRGRPDARSKSSVGTATISGYDMVGDTDPTNPTGPFYGNLDPVKQAEVLLYNPTANAWSQIFTGYTSDWTHVLDVSERKLDFTLDLVDMLDILNDAEIVPDQAGNLVPGESKGDVFYTGQHVDDRLLAVLADTGVDFPSGVFQPIFPNTALEGSGGQIASGNVFVQGRIYANRTTMLQVVDEACDAEGPGATNRFVTTDGVFAFRGRYYRYKVEDFIPSDGIRVSGARCLHWFVGDVPASLLDEDLSVYTGLTFTRGKTNLINASLVTPLGISDLDITGQFVYDATSVGIYGPRTEGTSYENIITSTADDGNTPKQETKSFGQATVDNYKDPVSRVSQLVFRNPPAGAPAARAAATWDLLCNIELSDLVSITSTHPGGGGFSAVKHFVEGITYDIKPLRGDEWDVTLTLDLSPRAYFDTLPPSWTPPT